MRLERTTSITRKSVKTTFQRYKEVSNQRLDAQDMPPRVQNRTPTFDYINRKPNKIKSPNNLHHHVGLRKSFLTIYDFSKNTSISPRYEKKTINRSLGQNKSSNEG